MDKMSFSGLGNRINDFDLMYYLMNKHIKIEFN